MSWDKVHKLERLAKSDNPHESALAKEFASKLRKKLPPERLAQPAQPEVLYQVNYTFEAMRWNRSETVRKVREIISRMSFRKITLQEEKKFMSSKCKVHAIGKELDLQTLLICIQLVES